MPQVNEVSWLFSLLLFFSLLYFYLFSIFYISFGGVNHFKVNSLFSFYYNFLV